MDLKETSILGDAIGDHWYYRSKAAALLSLIRGRSHSSVLDIGSGSAFFAKMLLANTTCREAWCVDTSYAEDSEATDSEKPIHYRRSIATCKADLVLLMDVLEHVDDDLALLSHYVDIASLGATFVVSVPAFQFMWSGHDEFLGHKRRYTLREVEDLVGRAGLTLQTGCYFFALVFPIAWLTRALGKRAHGSQPPKSQLRSHSKPMNGALASLCRMELPLLQLNRFAGLTVFCVASKP